MKNILIIAVSTLLFGLNANAQVKNINVPEFEKMVSTLEPNEVLLDVRSKKEVKEGYIEGMTHLDFHSASFEEVIQKLDKSKTYFVYCAAGGRSFKAAKLLEENGIKSVYNLNGGIIAWNKAGIKYEK